MDMFTELGKFFKKTTSVKTLCNNPSTVIFMIILNGLMNTSRKHNTTTGYYHSFNQKALASSWLSVSDKYALLS